MYELMNCEKFSPNMRERFMAFSAKVDISQYLQHAHLKTSEKVGYVDPD